MYLTLYILFYLFTSIYSVFPIPNKVAGEFTEIIGNPHLVNTRVFGV